MKRFQASAELHRVGCCSFIRTEDRDFTIQSLRRHLSNSLVLSWISRAVSASKWRNGSRFNIIGAIDGNWVKETGGRKMKTRSEPEDDEEQMKRGLTRGLSNSPGIGRVSCAKQEKDGESGNEVGRRWKRAVTLESGQRWKGDETREREISSEQRHLNSLFRLALNTAARSLSRSSRTSANGTELLGVLVRQLMSYSRCKKENDRPERNEKENERRNEATERIETSYRYESATGYQHRAHSFTFKPLFFSPSLPHLSSTVSHYYFTVFADFPPSFCRFSPLLDEMNPTLKRATRNVNGTYSVSNWKPIG